MSLSEKDLENALCAAIRSGGMQDISINEATSSATNLAHLIGGQKFNLLQDNSDWNQHKHILQDVSGGMVPDIVIRSQISNENRIIIEIKHNQPLNYSQDDSQIIRYFLHLIATSRQRKEDNTEIKRGVLLAAPRAWFDSPKNNQYWRHFINSYGGLARALDITLGWIPLDVPKAT